MATNLRSVARREAIADYSQVYNPATGNYIKRDTSTGKFIDVKSDGKPFKGIRREKTIIKANPNVDANTARKAEEAVIAVKNRKSTK